MSVIEKILPPIVGLPDHKKIKSIHLILSLNAASMHLNLGNGALGHLALTVTAATYQTLAGIPFVNPPNPDANIHIPVGSTGPQISAIERTHNVTKQEFIDYTNVDGT